ncbi:MAG: pilus assembly protein PilP [Proteobacteria bacterium]|nr:pilus assembly protein PilP [Pseudomonadota bacterium]
MVKSKKYNIAGFLSCLCLVFFLSGCGDETSAPPAAVKTPVVKKKVKKPAKDQKKEKEAVEEVKFVYEPDGKRDPFLPFLATMLVGEDLEAVDEELLTELERYDLSQLKLVAIMDIAGKWVAQVETPDGMGHTIYVGTPIGNKRGKVVSIKDGKVSVEEKFRDILGDIKTNIDELLIEHPEGGLGL